MQEIFYQLYCIKWVLADLQKEILYILEKMTFFDINQTRMLFYKENTKV